MRINKIMDGMLAFRTGFAYSHGADKARSASVRPTLRMLSIRSRGVLNSYYEFELNGELAYGDFVLSAGDKLKCYAKITEDDSKPDEGKKTETHKVTKEEQENGFEVTFDVYVKENGGKNKGKSAHFEVVFSFTPL